MEATLRGEIEALRNDMEKMEATLQSNMEKVETTLRGEIEALRAEMRALELRLTIKLGGILVLALGLMTAINKLLGATPPAP